MDRTGSLCQTSTFL